jgi:hypothetical protein
MECWFNYLFYIKMALTEKTIIDKIEILENNFIQVRTANIIEKDGVEISRTFHRHVVNPSNDISGEDAKVQAVANAVWTEEIIAAYLQSQKIKNYETNSTNYNLEKRRKPRG